MLYVDSEESDCANYAGTRAIDGNAATMWVTDYCYGAAPSPPHEIQIDLGANYNIAGFQYLPRQDQLSSGNIANYEFYISMDGANWGTAVSTGMLMANAADHTQKQVTFSGVIGRYVRLRALSEVAGRPWTDIAELNVLGSAVAASGPQVASVTLNPSSFAGGGNSATATVTLTGVPATNATIMLASSNPNAAIVPGSVTVTAGAITATFTVTSAPVVSTTTTSIINATVNGSTGATLLTVTPNRIPKTAWRVTYVDSEASDCGNYAASNAIDSNSATMWVTEYCHGSPPPPHEIQIDLGDTYGITGFQYLPRQDQISSGDIANYEFYVSADGATWGSPVSSGTLITNAADHSLKQVTFSGAIGRYARLRALSEVSGLPWTNAAELNVLGSSLLIPQTAWHVLYADSEEIGCGNYAASNAFDGNATTLWVTNFCYGVLPPAPPHEIQIDLGGNYTLVGFRYLPRQDHLSNGDISNYEFYVSMDGVNWGAAVSTGALTTNASDSSAKQVMFPAAVGRYIRLRALNEVTGRPWTNIAELSVLGVAAKIGDLQVASVTLNPVPISGGNVATGTVTLTGPPPTNATIMLSSSNPGAATVPATVTVNAGATTATFTVTSASLLGATATSVIGATFNGSTGATLLTVTPTRIPKTAWRVTYVDSEASDCGNYAASNAIDGNSATMWITEYCHGSPPPPHEIQIDLGDSYGITGFQYLPRQDQISSGDIANYEFYVSTDGVNWGTAVSSGTLINNAADHTLKQVTFAAIVARYVRLRALSEVRGEPWINAAELNVLGAAGMPSVPQVASVTLNPDSIPGGGRSSTATVALTSAPATSATVMVTNSNPNAAQVPTAVTVNAGTITATFAVTSASSINTISTSVIGAILNGSAKAATLTVTPEVASANLIPHAGWRLLYADSQASTCGSYGASNAFDGNPATMWVTDFCDGAAPPPHEIQMDLGANYTIEGFQYLPRQDQLSSGDIANYEFYVSTDGVNWGAPVASGSLITNAADHTLKQVTFSSVIGRYVRLRALSEIRGGPWTTVAELNVLGSATTASGPQVARLTVSPSSIAGGGNTAIATVALTSAPATDVTVTLSSSNPSAAAVPATITVNAGATTATLPVSTPYFVSTTTTSIISATFNNSSGAALLTITPTSIPKADWHVLYVDSEANDCGNYGAGNAIDGNSATMWVTEYCHGAPPPPHEIQIDLGTTYTIDGFQYLPRQDQSYYGDIGNYEFYVSMDGVTWGTAMAAGTLITNPADHTQKQVTFAAVRGRYVRLRALKEVNGGPWTNAAEINVLGTVAIGLNQTWVTMGAGNQVSLTATVTGTANHDVTWTASCGTLSATSGATVIYTAPASRARCTATATSAADPSRKATATFDVSLTVRLSPGTAVVGANGSVGITAYLVGAGGVTWTSSAGSISGDGLSVTYLAPASAGTYTVTATTTLDGVTNSTAVITVDTAPPSVPTGLTATAISPSQIYLSWTSPTDDIAVAGYKIYRAGTQVGTAGAPYFAEAGLSPTTAYSYTVSAYDVAGNESALSEAASATTTESGWIAPIGIPKPPFGVDENAPPRPNPWSSTVAGYYYVSPTGCTNTNNTYGYPGLPRCSIPTSLPPGSVVEIHETYTVDHEDHPINFDCTSSSPCWIRGQDNSDNRPIVTGGLAVRGSYGIIENIYFDHHAGGGQGVASLATVANNDHLVFRHTEAIGDTTCTSVYCGAGFNVGSWADDSPAGTTNSFIVFWDNYCHDMGDMSRLDFDSDNLCFIAQRYVDHIWFVDNRCENTTGVCVQAVSGDAAGNNPGDTRFIYIGRNVATNEAQAAFWVKGSQDVIVSQNTAYNIVTSPAGGPSTGFGYQYGPERVWFLFNKSYNNAYGFRSGSDNDGTGRDYYFVGNEIYHITGSQGFDVYNCWENAAFAIAGGEQSELYILNNTIYDYHSGIHFCYYPPGTAYIENNIFMNRNDATRAEIIFEDGSYANRATIRNNIFHDSAGKFRVWWDGTEYTTYDAWKSGTGKCDSGCSTADPQFVNAISADFHLLGASPAKDSGILSTVYSRFHTLYGLDIQRDIDGMARPQGSAWDIGAHEYVGP